ncbi:hypothetical protein [Bradyrhizobium jicamae]|uniref:hypothetical protein n=1 Tax=Bradyrhizobium jicamae TaxID=280332 RepID=UPI001BAB2F92|nr:hypothetical protein [Bradyrhizobium jicamae]MBR0939243.1 hypothetical protein [Bradyrhizobium jicamae]
MGIDVQNGSEEEIDECCSLGDVQNLLLSYSGAIALDQVRVDCLPPASFHKQYSRGTWKRYRRRHLEFINHLMVSLEQIPERTLGELTLLAERRRTRTVRNALVDLLSQAATDAFAPGQIDSAPLFFDFLIREVGCGVLESAERGDFRERMMCWLKPIDPLSIADDPECDYLPALQRRVHSGF